MRLLLTVAVLALDFWAISSIVGAKTRARSKFGWSLAVVALPLAGVLAWWRFRPQNPSRERHE